MNKFNKALALYTVYKELQKNLQCTLCSIKKAGYEGVEFYGECQWPALRVKELLEESQLTICGWHTEWKLLQKETLKGTIRYHKELGNKNIIIPCLGGPWNIAHTASENSAKTWIKHAEEMNILNKQLKQEGLTLGYHTHAHEFEDNFDGITPWNILCDHTEKDIFLELDTGNCMEGGSDPAEMLKKAANRLKVIHCKPFGGILKTETILGSKEDDSNWPKILQACEGSSLEWLAIENEAETLGDKITVASKDLQGLMQYLQ
ncbi:MAG: sugar phosphate isomerase/epimerase [Anaerocolumna sp.]